MARGLSRPIGDILAKNRGIVATARAQVAASRDLCSTSRNLIQRIANLHEFVHENVLTSRRLRRVSQFMAVNALPRFSRDTKRTELHFLLTEVSAGRTFAAIAEGKNGVEADRTRAHARAAYDSVVRFVDRVSLTHKERKELLAALNKLKQRLQALGEPL